MSTLLEWGPVRRGDRAALEAFECTEARKTRRHGGRWEPFHTRPWELQVQAMVHKVNPRCQPPNFCLVGRDSLGLGAVVYFEELDGPAQVEVVFVAVAQRLRRRGGGCADEAMRTLFDVATTRALEQGVDLVEILTWIDEENRPSQSLARRFGMMQARAECGDPRLQRWTVTLLVGGADVSD